VCSVGVAAAFTAGTVARSTSSAEAMRCRLPIEAVCRRPCSSLQTKSVDTRRRGQIILRHQRVISQPPNARTDRPHLTNVHNSPHLTEVNPSPTPRKLPHRIGDKHADQASVADWPGLGDADRQRDQPNN
jgi:hypothetical protein